MIQFLKLELFVKLIKVISINKSINKENIS